MVSKRFHLTIYRVLHEESESELKNDQILQPYAVFSIFRTRKSFKKKIEPFLCFFGPEIQLVVSRRFHLTIYRVLHEKSESELKNYQILQRYAIFVCEKRPKKFKKK